MKRQIALLVGLILLTGISACNLPGTRPDQTVPDDGSDDQQPPAVVASNTPEFTFTPSNTPLPTFTFTPSVPMVSVSVDTNCRTGPGEPYDKIGVLHVGESAEVVGKAPYGGSWIIKNPDGAGTCWLWDQYATVIGDTQGLPVADIPPTPTPTAGFSFTYLGLTVCAPQYAFRFQINNVGSITWQSIRIVATDNTTATTFTHILDSFRSYNGCMFEMNNQDLEAGENGNVANVNPGQFNYDPTGHSITATITICSEDGLGGTCLSQTLNFNP